MEHHTSASIEILGSELRYAEVERDGVRANLVRLGSCDFDFDLEQAIEKGKAGELETLSQAVRDILAGSPALDLHVALHHPLGSSLFVPIPIDTPKQERLKRLWQDVAVAFPGEETAFSAELVRPEVMPDGENVEWWHVLAVPAHVAQGLEKILSRSEIARRRFCAAQSGIAAIVRTFAREQVEKTPMTRPYRIAIGNYPAYAEVIVMRNQAWQYGATFDGRTSADRMYSITSLLDGIGIPQTEVVQVFQYGTEGAGVLLQAVSALVGVESVPLDPLLVVEHQVEGLKSGISMASYAACVGANLRDVYS